MSTIVQAGRTTNPPRLRFWAELGLMIRRLMSYFKYPGIRMSPSMRHAGAASPDVRYH